VTPTAEQQAIVDAYSATKNLVIEAGAGTGKTSTLRMTAAARPQRRATYIAYNRAIADDARRSFPPNVQCATAHALAFRAIGRQFRDRLNGPRMPARVTAQLLRVEPLRVSDEVVLTAQQVARLVTDTHGRTVLLLRRPRRPRRTRPSAARRQQPSRAVHAAPDGRAAGPQGVGGPVPAQWPVEIHP
jgi:hypothetical protein